MTLVGLYRLVRDVVVGVAGDDPGGVDVVVAVLGLFFLLASLDVVNSTTAVDASSTACTSCSGRSCCRSPARPSTSRPACT